MSISVDVHPDYHPTVAYEDRRLFVRAATTQTGGAPFSIFIEDQSGKQYAEFTIFTHDQAYADRLVRMINLARAVPPVDDEGALHIDQLIDSMDAVGIKTVIVDDDTPPPAA